MISLLVVGTPDFNARVAAMLRGNSASCSVHTTPLGGAWSSYLSIHPDMVIFEIGLNHRATLHKELRTTLSQIRERFGTAPYIALALTSPERLGYGGDLLFQEGLSFEPSLLIDALIVPIASGISLTSFKDQLIDLIDHVSAELARRASGKPPLPPLGAAGWVQSLADPRTRSLWMRWLPRYAGYTNENPVIIGETGAGKTYLAYALHLLSARKGKFVSITPRDFSSSELIQAELFGAVAGAYTGAVDKWGLVRLAEGGTLFIDELQSIDKELQGKLITFIENKIYRRVGSSESVQADVRFVFASNQSLDVMRERGTLREDFAYRLERVLLEIPPLRTRPLDVASGLAFALAKIQRQRSESHPIDGVSPGAYRALLHHPWPGNLRQLENTVARLCDYADLKGLSVIDDATMLTVVPDLVPVGASPHEVVARAAYELSRKALVEKLTESDAAVVAFKDLLRLRALDATGGDPIEAAKLIGEHEKILALFAGSRQFGAR